ncbi:MAG: hypothetical protein AC479_05400 [miscellaneous Crenarchaeota group-6 archaeon AD8-1]|nr:MAG: hypothetical protein AC479_05400 [miscellaneous Crenarchaeota group-6 archaeon AD8-1]
MKFGTFVYEPEKAEGFDFHVLRVKQETGKRISPVSDMASNIAVFADNVAGKNPEWISQSLLGPAKFGNNNYNIYWNVICATQPEHRVEQLNYIQEVDRLSPGIWLNSQYFADHGHCICRRCVKHWKKSGLGWLEWRRKEVTDYIAQIRENTKKELVMCLQPDPITAYERYGVDFDDLAKYADAFNIVMLSKSYATPWYWEMLSRGFKKLLKKPVYISLYVSAYGDKTEDIPSATELLINSVRCARTGIDGILYFAASAKNILDFQKKLINNFDLRKRLKNYGKKPAQEVLDLVSNWEKLFN